MRGSQNVQVVSVLYFVLKRLVPKAHLPSLYYNDKDKSKLNVTQKPLVVKANKPNLSTYVYSLLGVLTAYETPRQCS